MTGRVPMVRTRGLLLAGGVPAAGSMVPRGRDPKRPWTGTLTSEAKDVIKRRVKEAMS